MKKIDITPETAGALRGLLRRAEEAYLTFENTQKELRNRYAELAGPVGQGEIAALRKDKDRIEVVTPADYLHEPNKGRWY